MISMTNLRREWLSNPRGDILAGVVVALALIPEAIGVSIIAGENVAARGGQPLAAQVRHGNHS